MAGTIETQVNSLSSHENEATPELAGTSRGRRVAIWAMVGAAVGVAALTVAVVGYGDDSSTNRHPPAVVEPEPTNHPDPLVTRFGRPDGDAPDKVYPIGGGGYVK